MISLINIFLRLSRRVVLLNLTLHDSTIPLLDVKISSPVRSPKAPILPFSLLALHCLYARAS